MANIGLITELVASSFSSSGRAVRIARRPTVPRLDCQPALLRGGVVRRRCGGQASHQRDHAECGEVVAANPHPTTSRLPACVMCQSTWRTAILASSSGRRHTVAACPPRRWADHQHHRIWTTRRRWRNCRAAAAHRCSLECPLSARAAGIGARCATLRDPFQHCFRPRAQSYRTRCYPIPGARPSHAVSVGFFNDVRSTDLVPERIEAEKAGSALARRTEGSSYLCALGQGLSIDVMKKPTDIACEGRYAGIDSISFDKIEARGRKQWAGRDHAELPQRAYCRSPC